ncbi:MAG: tetratricopeptide repeat protein [Geminicoccaceae bacterium]
MPRGRLVQIAVVALALMSAGMRSPPAWSGQDDGRLNGLFERLKATSMPAEAKDVEQQIWQIWLESDDPLVERLMRQGIAAMSLQQYDLALESFDRIVEHAPRFAEGWNQRATLHYLMQDYRKSVLDIERTLELEPRHFGALSGLGQIYDALDEPQAALRAFEAALAIDPHLEGIRARVEELRRQLRGRPT